MTENNQDRDISDLLYELGREHENVCSAYEWGNIVSDKEIKEVENQIKAQFKQVKERVEELEKGNDLLDKAYRGEKTWHEILKKELAKLQEEQNKYAIRYMCLANDVLDTLGFIFENNKAQNLVWDLQREMKHMLPEFPDTEPGEGGENG